MQKLALLITVLFAVPAFAGPREALWKKVEEAVNEGLPKTAVERLEPIIAGALKDGAHAEAVKAIGRRISLQAEIEGQRPEEKIVRMKAELAKAPPEMRPVMHAILANWYWHYFIENNWRLMQRTATTAPTGDDLATWDLPRIFAEIDAQFAAALAGEDKLKATPIAQFDDLLDKGSLPDAYRPTLFDFLAYEALAFYSAGEQGGVRAEDAFDLPADSPVFAPMEEFLRWQVPATDERSPTLKALRLYQKLLQFHRDDADPAARLDADLWRLEFGNDRVFGEEKDARYKAALKRFVDKWGDHEVSARAGFLWASVLYLENNFVEARRLAKQGADAFPKSVGGGRCTNLVVQIEAPSSQLSVERVWNEPWPTIRVQYRNLTKVYFRLVPYDFETRLRTRRERPEQIDEKDRAALLTKKPTFAWNADLPPTDDYRERTAELALPEEVRNISRRDAETQRKEKASEGLKPGAYFLLSSHDPQFGEKNNVVSVTDVWISKLALVMRQRMGDGQTAGLVLDALTGEPLAGADVRCWFRSDRGDFTPGPTARTDEHGLFACPVPDNRIHLVHVRWEDQELATANDYANHRQPAQDNAFLQTEFFTDRPLYRPGQTIRYKGICIRVDQDRDSYQTLAQQSLTVVFADANGKEIARQQHRTNGYGSFNGSFTAPRDRVTGQMTLRVDGGPDGMAAFNVEEYKRPKFVVKLEWPKEAAKLDAQVTLEGKATAYTGAAINGAKVSYRVTREVRFPPWCAFYGGEWMPPGEPQEIARGSAVTEADGSFRIRFTARPDRNVPVKNEPVFQFRVTADVTDGTGETRSDEHTVHVGYTALEASLTADDWQTADKPVSVKIATTTLDHEGQKAEGKIKIHRLRAPDRVLRPRGSGFNPDMPSAIVMALRQQELEAAVDDPSDPKAWPLGDIVAEHGFTTDAEGRATLAFPLPVGAYRAVLETQDRSGKRVTAQLLIKVLDPAAERFAIKVPSEVAAPAWTIEPGGEFRAVWGTGYDAGRAFVEVEHRGKLLQSYWTDRGRTQTVIKQAVNESMRGGFTVRVTMVRENRAYLTQQKVTVPWTNKNLTVKWEHLTSKLEPGQKETWTAVVTGPDAQKAVAEMVATLYDASLDAYLPFGWPLGFGVFRDDQSHVNSQFENMDKSLQHWLGSWPAPGIPVLLDYRKFPPDMAGAMLGYGVVTGSGGGMGGMGGMGQNGGMFGAAPMATPAMEVAPAGAGDVHCADMCVMDPRGAAKAGDGRMSVAAPVGLPGPPPGSRGPAPDLSKVAARANLNETAFFFPHLLSDKDGEVKIQFSMPEALTEWRFLGFAHDRDLRAGLLEAKTVTAKELMVQPNPPRFLREGDVLDFTVKVTNKSAARQTGSVRLTLADASSGQSVDAALKNAPADREFDVPAGESRSFAWRLTVPDGLGFLTYKAVGSTGRLSDGEEGFLSVLPRRILVTESLPLPIRGVQSKEFDFAKLRQSGASDTLRHQSLTVQMVSQPAWYAVMALPYLMEFPHECCEQTFNRLYANALARHVAQSDPKIRRVFEQWRGTPALDSPLLKNQDLKAVMIEETPWWRQAQAESQARRNVAVLFDDNRLNDETARGLRKLTEQQRPDGAWPWFPGGPANDYITLYIATGFGRLRHLGADLDVTPANNAWNRLDVWIEEQHREILKRRKPNENYLTSTIALYLYGRSFFLEDRPIDDAHRAAVDFFLGQARKHWLRVGCRQSQAHLAIALKRFGDRATASAIVRSLREHAVTNEELGMFWRDTESAWWWYHAPIETQAMMIEAFDEVAGDAAAVEECKVWLLKQKQTQDWKTTKATADAVYALLLRGTNLLASDKLVEISLGGQAIKPEKVEAGTGFFEKRFAAGDVKPDLGRITLQKNDSGVAWGSLHWQYFEDMAKLTPHDSTPLKLKKRLFVRQHTKTGPVLEPVAGAVKVGDELVVRIELRVDRDMEYVHLKDQRGSGTEPVNVLSGYRSQDGLWYYESTRDTASHFFIDYLPKGTYVFEYSTRIVHAGRYQTGMAHIQCMYAPEFNSHSESLPLVVQ